MSGYSLTIPYVDKRHRIHTQLMLNFPTAEEAVRELLLFQVNNGLNLAPYAGNWERSVEVHPCHGQAKTPHYLPLDEPALVEALKPGTDWLTVLWRLASDQLPLTGFEWIFPQYGTIWPINDPGGQAHKPKKPPVVRWPGEQLILL